MPAEPIVVVDGARTPVGSFGGAFKDTPAHRLGAVAAREALTRAGVAPETIDEVVMGCIGQVGADAYNARRVVGATGAILTLRLAKDLARRDLELGVVTMCIGGGQALAALFRRV
ncbi:hypothetical protein [Streptomyces sp. NPDC050388]|uniref:thiolase family protein n=1 Tax=Streptomyces sp. NPDC050388 TaxID=3155781 RepID=UPI0034181212